MPGIRPLPSFPGRLAAVVTMALAVLVGSSACSGAPSSSPSPAQSASASPSATASALPDDPESELFTVSARARASDGTSLDLMLTGYLPLASTDAAAEDLRDDYIAECAGAGGMSLFDTATPVSEQTLTDFGSALMRIDYSVSPERHTLTSLVDVVAGIDNFPVVAVGDSLELVQSTDTCLNRYVLTGSGTGSFIANFETGEVNPDVQQWRFGSYGFTVAADSGATLETCDVTVSELGRQDLGDVSGWPDGAVGTGISCGTGFTGE